MAAEPSLKADEKLFMEELYRRADGDPATKVETAEVGKTMGLEKKEASRLSEELIAKGLVEIITLSGAIALTREGVELVRAEIEQGSNSSVGLGNKPLLDQSAQTAAETLLAAVKTEIAATQDFDLLSAVVSDIRCAEIQLGSPRPHTAVVRAAMEALAEDLEKGGQTHTAARVRNVLNA